MVQIPLRRAHRLTSGVSFGGTTGVASGNSSADTPRPLGSFSDSTHRKKVSFSSSIAAQPERLKLADTAIEASATRAQARIETLVKRPSSVGGAPRVPWLWFPRG